jgi:predicted extracellular nuclease
VEKHRFMLILLTLICLIVLAAPASAQDAPDCDAVLEIWQIQGAGEEANCIRKRLTTEDNIVTAIGDRGFFIQTPTERSDNDPATSDGIYVFINYPTNRLELQAGDRVNVYGRVEEIYNYTQLSVFHNKVEVVSSGNPLPEAIDLTTVDLTWPEGAPHPLERYEGMYAQIVDVEVSATTNKWDEFGVMLTGGRSFREPGIERDDTPEFAGIGLPEWDLNPELIEVDPPEMGLDPVQLLVGSRATAIGAIGYTYNDYQLWPSRIETEAADFVPTPVRAREAGEFIIATQNVENLFDILDDPDREDSVYDDYVPDNEEDYQIRIMKTSAQVRVMLGAPDILAIQEIENENVVNDLIAQIQADDPTLVYTGCIYEGHDTRGIDNAYLIRTDTVNVIDCFQMPGSYEARAYDGGELYGRPPLVLQAELLAESGNFPIILINMHVRSLSGSETRHTQMKRMMQAEGVAAYVQAHMDENPDVNVVVLGDLNAFQFTDGLVDVVGILSGTHDPAEAVTAPEEDTLEPNLVNQIMRVPQETRYSYLYNGSYQVLDHILTTPALDGYVSHAQFAHGNAEALTTWFLDLEKGGMRTSDHDGFAIYVIPE